MSDFKLHSPFAPAGDQQQAIAKLAAGVRQGLEHQVLLGVTGSGKTFTMANLIAELNRPTLIIAHNKTLAAQLCGEFKEFFPENAVEYFVSYYDYYQPEAYIPSSDTYIAKDSAINDEIDKMRHLSTATLLSRRDVIIVASVSAIYGLGDPADYVDLSLKLGVGQQVDRNLLCSRLVGMQYKRNEYDLARGTFRIKGDTIDICPIGSEGEAYRIEQFGDEIEKIRVFDTTTGEITSTPAVVMIYPANHYVTSEEKLKKACVLIRDELAERLAELRAQNKLLEAQRLEQRTTFDLEMLEELGYCSGIENYSRHLTGRAQGEAPYTLMDFFPTDYLLIIDESHATVPQIGAMYQGDRSRKKSLVDYGFRLPSACDNRPLTFDEFQVKANQLVYVSATPGNYENNHCQQLVEQLVRPTGLLDPQIEVRPIEGQIDDLMTEIAEVTAAGYRILVTTLTKRMAESLTDYLNQAGIRVRYLHSEVKTFERMAIIRDLRLGEFDVLVGINLLREGLDLPEVALVAILDGDKEGFLRSERSLIQTIGRAARNAEGRVIIYADRMTDSMKAAIGETERRRAAQQKFNKEHGIVPKTIVKEIRDSLGQIMPSLANGNMAKPADKMTKKERDKLLISLEKEMKAAAKALNFEEAAQLRDLLLELKASTD